MTVDEVGRPAGVDGQPSDERLSEGVVDAVATALGCEPGPMGDCTDDEVLDPLYSVVDPDALDALFRPTGRDTQRTEGQVTFPYHGHEVTAHSDGHVSVEPLDVGDD
ncbi:HalOD1 output domain-containing protein [Haloarchaeobius sp. HRN-SO-5]|uniref:HalOD1 output domain-containing protein n=1 Tax=Haloarchaeobius sp. HRN-SO-5 TaxID=3446118 RepID=UPI003EB74497